MARLDIRVVRQGLTVSRARAKVLIQNGQISVNGSICRKPSTEVADTDIVDIIGEDIPYVGRGGLKLEYAIQTANLDLTDHICMDVGASTGGFTQCMLMHGASKVYAIDVGHDQLAPTLREDVRVVSLEGTDIRDLKPAEITDPISLLAVDVSFISLRLVLPAALSFLEDEGTAIVLIKPQFEAGPSAVGKHGLVTSRAAHERILQELLSFFDEISLSVRTLYPSPITGGSGNLEYLAVLTYTDVPGVQPDISAVVEQAFALRKKEK